MYFEGAYWLLGKMGETVEDDPFAAEFLGRLNRMAQGKPDPDFATDLLKRLTAPTVETGYVSRSKYDSDVKKAREEGRKAALEDVAAQNRAGKGPDMTPKGGGGGKPYSQMTREERVALSPEQRDAAVAREIGA